MKRKLKLKNKIKKLLCNSLLTIGLNEFYVREAHSQAILKPVTASEAKIYASIWEPVSEDDKRDESQKDWELVPTTEDENQPSSMVIWEILNSDDNTLIPPSENKSNPDFFLPSNLEDVEALLNTIPIQSKDFKPLLNISYAVPTASVLGEEEWRLISSTISPFKYANGTGNQNYAIQLDYGLSDKFQVSGFYSEADDPLNAQITGLDIRPGNFWEVFGGAARWRFFTNNYWSIALNSSLESWTVGSGGSDSFRKNSGDSASKRFNDSGKRRNPKPYWINISTINVACQ